MSNESNASVEFEGDIRGTVSKRYGEIAETGGASCCGGGAIELGMRDHAVAIGYSEDDLNALPEGANLGLGCGSPTSIAMIQEGMTVVDLGSGGGVDCFIAAKRVGSTGKVIGVDMTDAMLEKAREFAAKHNYDNVEFRKGFIEELPIDDNSVDLIISNCVVNLSPDKGQVFAEINRVLKPGGRAAISDIVLLKPLPEAILRDVEAYIGCISGAEMIGDYLGHAMGAGLNVARAERKSYDVLTILGCSPEAGKLIEKLPADFDGNAHVASLDLLAEKPGASVSLNVAAEPCCEPGGGCC